MKAGQTGQLEVENAQLMAELERERSDQAVHATTWAAQKPEKFAAWALSDREVGIRFFQVSQQLIDDIGIFEFGTSPYQKHRGLYVILSNRLQDFDPVVRTHNLFGHNRAVSTQSNASHHSFYPSRKYATRVGFDRACPGYASKLIILRAIYNFMKTKVHQKIGYIDGTLSAPSQFSDAEHKQINPAYTLWYRQDAILRSAILGSCSAEVQLLIALASTTSDAWSRLTTNLANMSKGRIIYLKAKLAKNPRGTRSTDAFFADMTKIAADLALVGSPVSDDDLVVHIMTQLGDDYDCECELRDRVAATDGLIATTNNTQRQSRGGFSHHGSFHGRAGNRGGGRSNSHGSTSNNRSNRYCRFCEYPGHDTRFCRKLQQFLKDNNCSFGENSLSAATANLTISPGGTSKATPQWLVDSVFVSSFSVSLHAHTGRSFPLSAAPSSHVPEASAGSLLSSSSSPSTAPSSQSSSAMSSSSSVVRPPRPLQEKKLNTHYFNDKFINHVAVAEPLTYMQARTDPKWRAGN
ncbi:unnamed protein product [Cuscuta campestris]|uniref:Uncharacterized protein n=1 Tax=Cuscuta campestris TaxID=132261 RepID=A0A484NCL4_9ASTE|nr:unnamed protein product [Cuscuta campestris]